MFVRITSMLRTIKRPTRVRPLASTSRTILCRRLASHNLERSDKPQRDAPPSQPQSRTLPQDERPRQSGPESQESQSADTTAALASINIDDIRERLRRWGVQKASAVRVRMDEFSSSAQAAFQQLGGRVNEVTGYHEIENLKRLVGENERKMNEIREEAKVAKLAYEEAVSRRSNSQRETNELLQRKSSWTDADVLRFTQLVRADHAHEQEEAAAQARVAAVEEAVERQFSELMRSILSRYHEEQVWSDKIRSASTYGSLAALGLNLAVFILAIVLVEPWKRKRLVQSFEKRVIELNEANQRVVEEGLRELRGSQGEQEKMLAEIRVAQAALKEIDGATSPAGGVHEGEIGSSMEIERDAKTAKDREILAFTAAGVFGIGIGISGYILGAYFGRG